MAEKLGYNDTDKAIRNHVDSEDIKTKPAEMAGNCGSRGKPGAMIDESGFYSLILS